MLIAYSFTHLARMCLYFLSSFALIVLGRRHSGTDSAHRGINLRSSPNLKRCSVYLTYPPVIPRFLLVSLCCCEICSILKSLPVASIMLLLISNDISRNMNEGCVKHSNGYFPSICNHILQCRLSSSLPSNLHGTSRTSLNPSSTEGAS
jgi:hypothetical protein